MAYNYGYQYNPVPMPNYSQYPNVPPAMSPQQTMQAGQLPQQQTTQTQQQIQNGGFISVPSENAVLNYPVAPGNCVTFKIEGQPIVMEKSMGFSQLEAPHIEKYRLVKEEVVKEVEKPKESNVDLQPLNERMDTFNKEVESIWSDIEKIKTDIEAMKDAMPITSKRTTSKKKDEGED